MNGRSDNSKWSDRELYDFAQALQRYGSSETKKIALAVKTKSESAVKSLLHSRVAKARKQLSGAGKRGRSSSFRSLRPKPGTAQDWPAVRKWAKIAQNQQMECVRKVDYSPLAMTELFERFSLESPAPSSPEVVDCGAIYRFLGATVGGNCPPELPPKESAVLLMITKLMRQMLCSFDFSEECKFVQDFKQATRFVPFQVKDEFKKKNNAVSPSLPPGSIPVPEEMHCLLSRHRKVLQSFNPLSLPLWHLAKEQNHFESMFENAPK